MSSYIFTIILIVAFWITLFLIKEHIVEIIITKEVEKTKSEIMKKIFNDKDVEFLEKMYKTFGEN